MPEIKCFLKSVGRQISSAQDGAARTAHCTVAHGKGGLKSVAPGSVRTNWSWRCFSWVRGALRRSRGIFVSLFGR